MRAFSPADMRIARTVASGSPASNDGASRSSIATACFAFDPRRLHDLGQAGAAFGFRQRRQRLDVAEHEARLMKRSDQVLAVNRIEAGLAADRAVDHREQRRRHVPDANAAQQGGGRKAAHVADHAAADARPRAVAIDAAGQRRLPDLLDAAQRLVLFAGAAARRPVTW